MARSCLCNNLYLHCVNYVDFILRKLLVVLKVPALNIVTCKPIARERVGKHVSVEMDSWKPTR
jgi:hypothetical protein